MSTPIYFLGSSCIRSISYTPIREVSQEVETKFLLAARELDKLVKERGFDISTITGVTIISFHSGGKYAYLTPYSVYMKVLWSKSKGKAFHESVKGKYPSIKLN